MLNTGLMSSDRPDWNTPPEFMERVYRVGPVALDPCSNPTSIVKARTAWSLENGDDGLAHSWIAYAGRELVYVNPPYGREIAAWMAHCFDNAGEVIALVPARTDARWFASYCWAASRICFVRGRLKFLGAPSSAPFPSAVVYWGQRYAQRFAEVFGEIGKVVTP